MFDDVESDFWKQKFINLQKENMNEKNPERLTMDMAKKEIAMFKTKFPESIVYVQDSGSYISWELFLTSTTKFRLYIQNQIKASLMQETKGEFIKTVDAKFLNNPFPHIADFYRNKDQYINEVAQLKQEAYRTKKQQKIIGEIIKALLQKKFQKNKTESWQLEPLKNDFKLIVNDLSKSSAAEYVISLTDFKNDISRLQF